MPDGEEVQHAGTQRKDREGRDALLDGRLLVKRAREGGCNVGERRAWRAK